MNTVNLSHRRPARTVFVSLHNGRAAFTLVELLVVIGIIAALVGILIPVLSKVREHSRTAVCSANLHELAFACIHYSGDNNDKIIPASWIKTPATNTLSDAKSFYCNELWCNILVNKRYVVAPDGSEGKGGLGGKELGPQHKSVFYCPSGMDEFVSNAQVYNSGTYPASRVDLGGAQAVRAYSHSTKTSVDTWYGINGENGDRSLAGGKTVPYDQGTPCRQQPAGVDANGKPFVAQVTMSTVNRPAEMVLLFDGIVYDLNTNASRLNARHDRQTKTNIAFFDGHVETIDTANLPGGLHPTAGSFTLSNLQTNYPQPKNPMWYLGQQQ